ncbi:zinc-dependent metalloprotease [Flavobacterium sp.]|uniref:zinc-dependent metalloprotease n=1 Tax=Flavobacterium sp. TaxID=239 RepID=UPI0026325D14|nr:zinc-dependent metalloprotease [Flavobacterium sp.]
MSKKLLLITVCILTICQVSAQTNKFWTAHEKENDKIITSKSVERASFPEKFDLYDLDINPLRAILFSATNRMVSNKGIVITLPNTKGELEQFEMFEASNFEADLQAQFPDIRSYVGRGLTDKEAQLRLSISPQGIQTMLFRSGKETEFIEPYSQDNKVYAVFNSSRKKGELPFVCSTEDIKTSENLLKNVTTDKSSAGQLLTFRIALSCNGEYANYFGATNSSQSGLVLAAFNNTLTRCNGIFEKDFAIHLNLIANTTSVIYYNTAADPYSSIPNEANWNKELQNTLTAIIGNANYDIGHFLGGGASGWANAGCIGCICVNDTTSLTDINKGGGTSSSYEGIPQGDNFDIDYVTHEIGHQLGANHTYSFTNEGLGKGVEPGSGSTIMSYAGVTAQDVQLHSDAYFHGLNIEQVQANMATKTCQTITPISQGFPVVSAGNNYVIPASTPFYLTGFATTTGSGPLTYCWEQMNSGTATTTGVNSGASTTKIIGPNFRSYSPSTSPIRYFPNLATLTAGLQVTQGLEIPVEALCSLNRLYNFRLTVRDNSPTLRNISTVAVGQTSFSDVEITVNAATGPFDVTSQAINGLILSQGASENITWTVNNTNTLSGSSNVDILLSTDGGLTYPVVLATNTLNDGLESITVPNIVAPNCRVMVKPTGNVFFDINSKSFAIGTLGVSDVEFQDFSLFPNPNHGTFAIRFVSKSSDDIKINVHDMRGRQIFEASYSNTGTFNQNITLNKVQSGVYLATITDGSNKTIKRIIIE